MIIYKKAIMLLAILALLAPGFLPYGFSISNNAAKNNMVSHTELCCCGNIASTCRDCCCSDDHPNNDTVTITACGGIPDGIVTISKLNYFSSLSAFVQYISVSTVAETSTPQFNDIQRRQPYKPPKPQLLSNLT